MNEWLGGTSEDEGGTGPRTYVSPLRRRQAEQTRERVCGAATRLFAQRGYVRTSVRQIAVEAEVSVETVYAAGGKAAVFLGAFELAFSSTADGASPLELDVLVPVWAAATLREAVEGMCAFLVETNARSAGLWKAYVEHAGWSVREYRDWLVTTVLTNLTQQAGATGP